MGDTAKQELARKRHQAVEAYLRDVRVLTERIASRPDDLQARLALARRHADFGFTRDAIKAYRFLLLRAPDMEAARREYEALAEAYGGTGQK